MTRTKLHNNFSNIRYVGNQNTTTPPKRSNEPVMSVAPPATDGETELDTCPLNSPKGEESPLPGYHKAVDTDLCINKSDVQTPLGSRPPTVESEVNINN